MLREPAGGYFACSTARCASSRVLTIGTTTPHAPASSAHLNHSTLFPGIRTIGAQVPASAIVATISAMSTGFCAVCSISTTSQSKPSRAMILAEGTLGRLNHAPSAGSPCFSFSFTRFVRIATHLSGGTTIEGLSLILVLWHCALRRCNNASCFYMVKPCCVASLSSLTLQKRVNLKGRWSRPLVCAVQALPHLRARL